MLCHSFRSRFNWLTLVFNTACFAWCLSYDMLLKLKTELQEAYCLLKLPRTSHVSEAVVIISIIVVVVAITITTTNVTVLDCMPC